MYWHRQIDVNLGRNGSHSRREFLRGISAASVAAGTLGWTDILSLRAEDLRRRNRACILLWMQGGPSQFETFDPKPGHSNGGPTRAIATSVAGIQISENLPHVAKAMDRFALVRSMTSKEGSHPRASYLLHTGYLPSPSVKYPALGAVVSHELANAKLDLPAFVRIGNGLQNGSGGGLLGAAHEPFVMMSAGKPPTNAVLTTNSKRFESRLDLLDRLEARQSRAALAREAAEHAQLYRRASRMVLSTQMEAFDLDREPESARKMYGSSQLGLSCLLARRLVEAGVPFIELVTSGWDTHFDNFPLTKQLSASVDQPLATLVADLAQRGMLDTTLVVWMGEFGRTPHINPRAGRDHYPRAFSVALAGGGIRGGQVIGSTDAGGSEVTSRPVTVSDLFRTFCRSMGIDPQKENAAANGRPIKIVDGGAVVNELFS